MRKKTFIKAVALVTCLCILSLSVPSVIAAERSVKRFHFIKKSAIMFYALFPFLSPIFDTGNNSPSAQKLSNSDGKIKVTGTLSRRKMSRQD